MPIYILGATDLKEKETVNSRESV